MKKTEIVESIQALIKENNVPQEVATKLMALVAKPIRQKREVHEPYTEGGITYCWCKYHQTYEKMTDMVVANNRSKGYCKAASALSNKRRNYIKMLEAKLLDELSSKPKKELEILKETIIKAKVLLHEPKSYNLENDWALFKNPDSGVDPFYGFLEKGDKDK